MESQPFKRAFWTLALAGLLLVLYPFLYRQSPFLQEHFRTYQISPAALRAAPADTLSVQDSTLALSAPEPPPKYDGRATLAAFYEVLHKQREQIRIGHYGDSSIEGDLITGSFRDSLQRRFGGQGIGLAPVVNPISGFRRTLRHSFSDNWNHCYIGKENRQELPRGINGEYFTSWAEPDTTLQPDTPPEADTLRAKGMEVENDPAHWTFYRRAALFPGSSIFPSARLFYAAPQPDSTGYLDVAGRLFIRAGRENIAFELDGSAAVNEQILSADPLRRLHLNFEIPPRQPIYGLSFESASGIIVDNFPSRGNSGAGLLQISQSTLRQFQNYLDYDLILMQFGLNALNEKMIDYRWYEREMGHVVRHFRKAMPGMAIMLIGPSDRAIKIGGSMQTDPSLPRITAALRRVAEANGTAFFSFYEAMGGQGSMIEWVEERQPRLANTDYTHFNFAGARKAALLLLDFLLEGYENHQSEKTTPEESNRTTKDD